ncbi:MAG TPA: HAMP domain-containing sensor histidine kinase, partial [Candidatus Dormibacteraeota bacterium]|nr:HAMP domain-containing sensor histidine kinase [Candidatus Dormibacteraeota bacterium]
KSDELTHLVEGLLMASRLEAGRLRPRRRELDLRMVVTEAVARLRPSVELHSARVDVDLPAGPLPVRADPDYLGRILDNLLVNGITYSKGRPQLRLSATSTPDGRVRVAVEDHGVGLRPEDQERIFERLERVEHAQLGFPAGTGLGLYLGRRLAEDMGGSLRLDWSSPGQGSRFVLELPAPVPPGWTGPAGSLAAGHRQAGIDEPSGNR